MEASHTDEKMGRAELGGGRLRPAGTPSHWGNALGVAVDIGYRPSQVGSETT